MLSKLKLLLGIATSDTTKDSLLELLIENATELAKNTLYPFVEDIASIELGSRYNTWILNASKEMYQNLGQENVKSYSENGLSISYAEMSSGVSYDLMSQLVPKVGIPR